MTMTTVKIGQRGVLSLPEKLRKKYGLKSGDAVTFIDLENVLVLSPKASRVSRLASQIEEMREKAGLSVQNLLEGLGEQRRRYRKEKGTVRDA